MSKLLRKRAGNRLTAVMIVRNESRRFLRLVLEDLSAYVDQIAVWDDASTDDTPEICLGYPKVVLERGKESLFFEDESELRSRAWQLAESTNPDWILAIDADEVFEERMKREVRFLIDQDVYDGVQFRIFDFWKGMTHYRVDGRWSPWGRFSTLLVRHHPGAKYTWPSLKFHCGRIPLECRSGIPVFQSDIRLKHYGWVRVEDHFRKYRAYIQADPEGIYQIRDHTESILAPDSSVVLEEWKEGRCPPF